MVNMNHVSLISAFNSSLKLNIFIYFLSFIKHYCHCLPGQTDSFLWYVKPEEQATLEKTGGRVPHLFI